MDSNIVNRIPDTDVLFGRGSIRELGNILNVRRTRTAAIFTGGHSADASGNFARLLKAFSDGSSGWVRFNRIPAEPDLGTIHAMTDFLEGNRPDTVIALGGGSVMDAAKAAYAAFQFKVPAETFFGSNAITEKFPDRKPDRIIAVPTTSGTGSEVTLYSNSVDRTRGVKKLISDPMIIPEIAIVDPDMTETMPDDVSLATGCDALAHLMEGFLNVGQDGRFPAANDFARTGIRLIRKHLQDFRNSREELALAAVLGGAVIRWKSTGLPHLASFSWFSRIPHGIAAILLLPAAWRYYLANPAVAERTMELAGIFPGKTQEEVITGFRRFLDECGVPAGLRAYQAIDDEVLERTAAKAGENPMKLALAPHPVPLDQAPEVLKKILQESR